MGQIQVPGTSVVLDNPKAVNQSTVVFPDCGDLASPQVAQINPQTGLPVGPSTRTGKTWQPHPVPTGTNAAWSNRPLIFAAPACPQPGSFDPTPATANPVLFNKQPVSLSSGGVQIPNSSTVVKNPA